MLNNLNQIIKSDEFKAIGENLTPQQFINQVIPKGFEYMVNISTDGYDVYITSTQDAGGYVPEIIIQSPLFNPDFRHFPKFLITNLKETLCVLNQNQLFHLMISYRFEMFKQYKRPYFNFISNDVKGIMRYIQYTESNAYNSKQKNKELTVILPYEKTEQLITNFSETVLNSRMDEDKWKAFFAKNPVTICSVGSMSSSNSVVLKGSKPTYRSVGLKEMKDGFVSIFPPAQNVPARQQTHCLGDTFHISEPSQSVIQQDNIVVNGKLVSKDSSLKKAITVFHPIESSGRFLSGEIEIDTEIADVLLEQNANIEECFSQIYVAIGEVYHPNFKDFELGLNLDEDPVIISNAYKIIVNDIITTGINSSRRIKITVVKRADNARITSNTGLKGVTKVVSNLGEIHFEKPENVDFTESWEESFEKQVAEEMSIKNKDISDLKRRYPALDIEDLNQYKPVEKISDEHLVITPNLICGMNSVKAKSNTIAMAQACLAVELGFYTPKEKQGFKGLLNSLDQKEINEAAQSLPKFTYLDQNGHEVPVEIGLVYISYTEICSIYTKVKDQSFPFLSGYYMSRNNEVSKEMYEYIWENYLEEEKVEASKELFKILLAADKGIYNNDDGLPLYSVEDLNNLFTENDLVLSTVNEFPTDSKLLDESFNSKGFIIDLSRFENAPVIRIPSAKTLNMFSGRLKNGNYIYHVNLVNVSKIIRGCLRDENGLRLNTVYSKNKDRQTSSLAYNAYLTTVRSTLFSGEVSSQQIVQSFIKPKITGCNFKQISDHHLPNNVIVINDDRVFKRLSKEAFEGSENIEKSQVEILLAISQIKSDKITNEEKKRLFKLLHDSSPRALTIRQPSLWSTQNMCAVIWDRFMYEIYLNLFHNKSLNEVMNTYYNRDIVLVSKNIVIWQHSDCDGDLLPTFVPKYEGQLILRKYKLTNILEEELDWHKRYHKKEFSSTEALNVEHTYKLHKISNEEYSNFLNNAVTAKGNIGVASLDIWAFSMIVESYQAFCEQNNYRYEKKVGTTSLTPVSDDEARLLVYTYTRLVQEMVIEGVKHVKNGSKDFDMYFLKNIGDKQHERKIRKDLSQIFGLSSTMIDKLLFVIRFAEDHHDLSKACRNFLSLYNKGRQPANRDALDYWEDFIAHNTYFGKLLLPLFDIKESYISQYEEALDDIDSLFSDDEDSLDLDMMF